MHRRLLVSILGTVLVVILAFGLPLGVVAARLVHDEAGRRLQQQADTLALDVEVGRATTTTTLVDPGTRVLVIDSTGAPTLLSGPPQGHRDDLVAEADTDTGRVVRLEAPAGPTDARIRRVLGVIGLAALGAAGLSVVMAVVLSRRLSRPLDELAHASARLGAGDFDVRAGHSGLPEMDAVADRLNASTEQLARMLERERHFSANASHQLRTALTALRIPLEELTLAEDRAEVRELTDLVIHQADRLQATIEELLALAQGRPEPSRDYDAAAVIADRAAAWRPVLAGQGRVLEAPGVGPVPASGSPATLRQVLDVLIDNARLHGAGTVRIEVEVRAGSAVVSVGDEGPGIAEGREQRIFERGTSFGAGRGVGLAVARDLLDHDGGRLVLARSRPPVFDAFLPRGEMTEPWSTPDVALAPT
jgi:signal transduction histidine kinase